MLRTEPSRAWASVSDEPVTGPHQLASVCWYNEISRNMLSLCMLVLASGYTKLMQMTCDKALST